MFRSSDDRNVVKRRRKLARIILGSELMEVLCLDRRNFRKTERSVSLLCGDRDDTRSRLQAEHLNYDLTEG
jgi:hypothetical protein